MIFIARWTYKEPMEVLVTYDEGSSDDAQV